MQAVYSESINKLKMSVRYTAVMLNVLGKVKVTHFIKLNLSYSGQELGELEHSLCNRGRAVWLSSIRS